MSSPSQFPTSRASLTLLLLLPSIAFSQTPSDSSTDPRDSEQNPAGGLVVLDRFTVTGGFAGSLAAAAEVKQTMPGITEIVAAEDIGKLPDISIADSLSRLPGLATQRLNGRSQAISIRGLTGDYTTGLLNGREQVSSNSNRTVEFDQYPAELLSSAVVYKTTQANLIGQGLAGTIDLRTVRPLTHGRRTVAANAFYDWTQLDALNAGSDDNGYRYSASYIDQFNEGTLGVAFGYSHADIPGQGEQWNAWGYPATSAEQHPDQPWVIGGAKPFVRSSELKRDGLMGVIEYKPSSTFHSTIDLYYSFFDETQLLRGIEIPLYWGPNGSGFQPGFTVDDGLVTNAVFNNVFNVVRNDIVARKADVYAGGWNVKFGDDAGWTFEGDLSYSRIDRKDRVLETYSGTGANQVGTPDTITVAMGSGRGATFTSALDYTDRNLVQLAGPQGWGSDVVPGGQAGYLKNPKSEDALTLFKFSAKRNLDGFFNLLDIGGSYSRRTKSEVEDGYYLALASGQTTGPLPSSTGVTDLSFIGISGMASYDPLAALYGGTYTALTNPHTDVISNDWDVAEKVAVGYVQLGLQSRIGGMPLTGNIGVQVMHTDQTSHGLSAVPIDGRSVNVPTEGGDRYWNVLPSLNLKLQLAERRFLRFSVAQQLARQRMNDMRAGRNTTFNSNLATSPNPGDAWNASGGNPELKPWRSNSVDLAFEHYFRDNMGYFAVSAFYKDLRTYTYNQKVIADFTGFPSGGVTPATYLGVYDRPANGDGGTIQGVEATLSLPSELIFPSVRGLGFIVSGAYNDSDIEPYGPGSAGTSIPGLSRKVASATIYYERGGFSARVSERYRSAYRGNIYTFGPRGENFRTIHTEQVIDAQISYEFKSGPMKGFTVILQGYNLTDEPLQTSEQGDPRLVVDYQSYGASYSAGVSYKF